MIDPPYVVYEIESQWWSDSSTPAEISGRVVETLDLLGHVAPAMRNWWVLDRVDLKAVPLSEVTSSLVTKNVTRDDGGEPDPEEGYCMLAHGSEVASENTQSDSVCISVTAGSKWINSASFEIGSPDLAKDFNLITYPIYKGALKAMASAWPLPWALAHTYSPDLPAVDVTGFGDGVRQSPFEIAWIGYLSAPLAAGSSPPPEIVCESTPGGGMILSAVEATIDQNSPEHMRRARILQAIMADCVGLDSSRPGAARHAPRVGPY